MEKAEVSVRWQDGTASFRRCVFASRESHLVFTRLTAKDGEIDVQLSLCLHDPETMPQGREIPHILQTAKEDFLYFAAENVSAYRPGDFGGVCRIFTDGKMLTLPDGIPGYRRHRNSGGHPPVCGRAAAAGFCKSGKGTGAAF